MNDALYLNFGDIVATILILGIPTILIFFISKAFKRDKERSNERLGMEKENAVMLQKRIDELNDRLVVVEEKLKEAE
ncbi:hypothetical protein [Planomicrobium sp. MB-3u-38]|uniref:hypothetical protein n=1 Tax=Planomicrobium sp. MB-3u-38 TaxID=2058318 RepID=UPI000C7E2C09|nr:hypothetical protein [Planomicrobium sp. MB-3u-38]PKH12204.1 hypothetical protein CXF70_01490 [Planomicrobium sp. MB-3u-38]